MSRRAHGRPEVPGRADALALAAVLLAYPDDGFYADAERIGTALAALPDSAAAEHLRRFWRAFGAWSPAEARAQYVETFDLRRTSSLHLSYYLHGDTRRRGMALLALKQRYRAHGYVPPEDELPDYLPLALEFAALRGAGPGEAPLRVHRAGLELIRTTLVERRSPYVEVLDAICAVLGPASDRHAAQAALIAAQGPAQEEVGLTPDFLDIESCPPSGVRGTIRKGS